MRKAVLATLMFVMFATAAFAAQATTDFTVQGMMCGSCKAKAEKALKNTTGVTAAVIDLENGTATVTYDDQKTNPEQLKKVIKDVGFTAEVKKSKS